jgi:hypothetical protein
MTQKLWLPPAAARKRAGIPEGEITLSTGQVLKPITGGQAGFARMGCEAANRWAEDPDAKDAVAVGLTVVASMDPSRHGSLLHVSVSRFAEDPTWAEIKAVRDAVYPDDIDVMMVLPKAADYVNAHEHCFHLWTTPDAWGRP